MVTVHEARLYSRGCLSEVVQLDSRHATLVGAGKAKLVGSMQVLEVRDIGAVVELPGGRDALVHISELSMEPVERAADAVKVGDAVDVFILSSTPSSTRASMAALERIKQGLPPAPERKRRAEGNGGGRGRGRGDRRGRGRGRGRESGSSEDEVVQPDTPRLQEAPLQAPPARGGIQ